MKSLHATATQVVCDGLIILMNMDKIKLIIGLLMYASIGINAQSTYDLVYDVFQTSCNYSSCHTNAFKAAGLDLEGSGPNAKAEVWNNLYDADPTNSYALSKGYKRIYPGDPYKSTLFRKVNHGLDDFVQLHSNEGASMPATAPLDDKKKELIRQWIVYNSPDTGKVADVNLINQYYDGYGVDAIASRPSPPAEGEGFQIKSGPFFLYANGEIEHYYKYNVANQDSIEIKGIYADLGQVYSHHLIVYRYRWGDTLVTPGLRGLEDLDHYKITIVTTHQQTEEVEFPKGTAKRWAPNTVLDLNTHFINYSGNVLKCENYYNVYTQPMHTAPQLLETELEVNFDLYVLNDGLDHTIIDEVFDTSEIETRYIWAMGTHTHQWGRDYDVWLRNPDGTKGEKIVDASNMDGMPNSVNIGYDYQHPPNRIWEYPFLEVSTGNGFIHEAVYNNSGPVPVQWGPTSQDEMMIFGYLYVTDTTGLGNFEVGIVKPEEQSKEFNIYPNPFDKTAKLSFSNPDNEEYTLMIYDMFGRLVMKKENINSESLIIKKEGLKTGIYLIKVGSINNTFTGQLVVN